MLYDKNDTPKIVKIVIYKTIKTIIVTKYFD